MSNPEELNGRSIKKGYLFGTDNKATQRPIKKRNMSPSDKTTQTISELENGEEYFDARDSGPQPSEQNANLDVPQSDTKSRSRSEFPTSDETSSLYVSLLSDEQQQKSSESDGDRRKSTLSSYVDAFDDKLVASTPDQRGPAKDEGRFYSLESDGEQQRKSSETYGDRRKSTQSSYVDAYDDKLVASTPDQRGPAKDEERFYSLENDATVNTSVYQDAVNDVSQTGKRQTASSLHSDHFKSIRDDEQDDPSNKTNQSEKLTGSGTRSITSNDSSERNFILCVIPIDNKKREKSQ